MANVRRGNIHFVDSTGTLTSRKEDRVVAVLVTATAANAVLVLSDTSDNNLFDLRNPTEGSTLHFSFENIPLTLSVGLKAKTVTNCTASIVYTGSTGGAGE
jgi:hypothetical protein